MGVVGLYVGEDSSGPDSYFGGAPRRTTDDVALGRVTLVRRDASEWEASKLEIASQIAIADGRFCACFAQHDSARDQRPLETLNGMSSSGRSGRTSRSTTR